MVINPIVGVYIPIIRIPIKGGRSPIPNIATFDHGTNRWSSNNTLMLHASIVALEYIGNRISGLRWKLYTKVIWKTVLSLSDLWNMDNLRCMLMYHFSIEHQGFPSNNVRSINVGFNLFCCFFCRWWKELRKLGSLFVGAAPTKTCFFTQPAEKKKTKQMHPINLQLVVI